MALLGDIRGWARSLAGPLVVACLVTYLGYHAIQGNRGVIVWLQLGQRIEQAEAALAVSRAEEARLARRVALLRPDGLDTDLLDERARAVLGLAHPDDLVIFTTPAAEPR